MEMDTAVINCKQEVMQHKKFNYRSTIHGNRAGLGLTVNDL